jgi:acyl-CoA thioesterase I
MHLVRYCFRGLVWSLITCAVFALAAAATPAQTVLVFGDSLSAGYGIDVSVGWVALLQRRLTQEGYGYTVVNASVSGETTGGGRDRLARALEVHRPKLVLLELGSNDALRGLPMKSIRENLKAMIEQSQAQHARVVLIGMMMPPNYGDAYTTQFQRMYSDLASEYKLPLVPFLLEGIALDPQSMQEDGLHPIAAAQPRVLGNVWPKLKPALEKKQ